MNTHRAFVRIILLGALLGLAGLLPDHGFTQGSFYQGKTITIIAGTAPGGIGDNRVKSVVPFLRKYIPGNPAKVQIITAAPVKITPTTMAQVRCMELRYFPRVWGEITGSDFYDSTISFSRSISRLAVSFACTRSLSRASKVASVAMSLPK